MCVCLCMCVCVCVCDKSGSTLWPAAPHSLIGRSVSLLVLRALPKLPLSRRAASTPSVGGERERERHRRTHRTIHFYLNAYSISKPASQTHETTHSFVNWGYIIINICELLSQTTEDRHILEMYFQNGEGRMGVGVGMGGWRCWWGHILFPFVNVVPEPVTVNGKCKGLERVAGAFVIYPPGTVHWGPHCTLL